MMECSGAVAVARVVIMAIIVALCVLAYRNAFGDEVFVGRIDWLGIFKRLFRIP